MSLRWSMNGFLPGDLIAKFLAMLLLHAPIALAQTRWSKAIWMAELACVLNQLLTCSSWFYFRVQMHLREISCSKEGRM